MRAALVLALVVAGCGGDSGPSSTAGVISASFSNLASPNTSGVAMSATFAACTYTAAAPALLTCNGSEAANNQGRMVTVSFTSAVVAGMDYPIGQSANVLFTDPTTFGTASGMRLWQAVPGTGAVHVSAVSAMHVGFTYYASMKPLGSPATGTFDLAGDGNVNLIVQAQ